MTALKDLQKYPSGTCVGILTAGGAIITGDIDSVDAFSVLLANSTVASAAGVVGVSGKTITVYLDDVSAHWDVNS